MVALDSIPVGGQNSLAGGAAVAVNQNIFQFLTYSEKILSKKNLSQEMLSSIQSMGAAEIKDGMSLILYLKSHVERTINFSDSVICIGSGLSNQKNAVRCSHIASLISAKPEC